MVGSRNTDGRFAESVPDDSLVHFFETGERPFYGAGEIAEEFNLSRSQAHRRLCELEDERELRRIELGKRNVAWWRQRDIVVLTEEEDGYSSHDIDGAVASQGDSRAEALRNLAEAIEAREGSGDVTPEEVYDEVGVDPSDVDDEQVPPFDD